MLPKIVPAQSQLLDVQIKNLENEAEALKNLPQGKRDKLVHAAKNFESFLFSYMYKEMYKAVPKSEIFGDNKYQETFMGLYIDEVSKQSASNPNGISAQLIKQYEKFATDKSDINEIKKTSDQVPTSLTSKIKTLAHRIAQEHTVARVFKDFDHMIDKVDHKISSKYGMRHHPLLKKMRFHDGIDLAITEGSKVKAPSHGKVVFAGDKGGYGNTVIVDHGHGITSLYAHLSEINVKQGDTIKKNHLLGKVGSTGLSTGPHLHFEVRQDGKSINPMHLVSK